MDISDQMLPEPMIGYALIHSTISTTLLLTLIKIVRQFNIEHQDLYGQLSLGNSTIRSIEFMASAWFLTTVYILFSMKIIQVTVGPIEFIIWALIFGGTFSAVIDFCLLLRNKELLIN